MYQLESTELSGADPTASSRGAEPRGPSREGRSKVAKSDGAVPRGPSGRGRSEMADQRDRTEGADPNWPIQEGLAEGAVPTKRCGSGRSEGPSGVGRFKMADQRGPNVRSRSDEAGLIRRGRSEGVNPTWRAVGADPRSLFRGGRAEPRRRDPRSGPNRVDEAKWAEPSGPSRLG